jgi:hypothetical protein
MNISALDDLFSEYIRLRDSDTNGICTCISCGFKDHWKDMDCGHYIVRKHMSLRFSERNCNAQCQNCNRFKYGNLKGYSMGLIRKYGPNILEELNTAKNQTVKIGRYEIEIMKAELKSKIKELKKVKMAA